MALSVLIDNNNLEVLKVVNSVRKAEYWADLLIPYNDFLIVGTAKKDLSYYNAYELAQLYFSLTGEHPPTDIEYAKLLAGVNAEIKKLDEDETPEDELQKRLGHDEPGVPPIGVKGDSETDETYWNDNPPENPVEETKAPPKKRHKGGAVKPIGRPKEGSATGKVWDIADSLLEAGGDFPTRQQVIEACEQNGLNKSTASTQYGKWKKFVEVTGSN